MIIRRSNTIPDILILQPEVFQDERGRFLEDFRVSDIKDLVDSFTGFAQCNSSYSLPGVLRGIHYQTRNPQGKLIRCISGRIQQVCVDLREGSPYFGKHVSTILDDLTCCSVYCPVGFGNAFLVPSGGPGATVIYQCTSYYLAEYDRSIAANDPELDIKWLTQGRNPIQSRKDRAAGPLGDIEPSKGIRLWYCPKSGGFVRLAQMPVSYLFPPDRSQAKSVALTPYASGILVAKWDEPVTWYWSGSSYTSAAWYLSTNSGFSAAAIGASSDAWLPQYYGGIAHYTSGGAQTEYVLPQADVITGCAFVPAYDCLYTIGATGAIYNVGNGVIPPTFILGHSWLGGPDLLGETLDISTIGSGFVENTSWFLSTSGTTLFTILGQDDSLGYFSLSSSGVGTSGAISLPMEVPSCLTAYTPTSTVVVGGWSYATTSSGFSYLFSDPQSYWTVGLTPIANTIGIYKTSPWGFLSFNQAITGFASPEFGDWSPDGLHLAVSYAATGIALFKSVFNTISYQTNLSVSGVGQVAFVSPANLIACQESSDRVSTFYATGGAWIQSNSLSLVEPSTITRTGPFSAAVGYSSGIAFVNISQSNQLLELDSTAPLPFKPLSIVSDTIGNIYAVGTQSNTGFLSIVSGQALETTLTWDGSGDSVAVFQDQILVIDSAYPVLRIFGYYQNAYQQISATLSVPPDVSGGVFVTANTPFSSGGVAFVCGSGTAWSYQFVSPFGVVNTPVGVVSIYHNESWTTTALGSGKIPSAAAYDIQSNLWVTTVQNDLYSLESFGGVRTHEVILPYTGQRPNTPLGFSSLITSGVYVYGASSLNGSLVYFGSGFPAVPLPPPPLSYTSLIIDIAAPVELKKPVIRRTAAFVESESISFDDINLSIEAPPMTWVLTIDSSTGIESNNRIRRDNTILDENS